MKPVLENSSESIEKDGSKAFSRSATLFSESPAITPFGESALVRQTAMDDESTAYHGRSFQPFARAFQHADYAVSERNASHQQVCSSQPGASVPEPLGRHFARAPYSHHAKEQEPNVSGGISYDEESQTCIFPPGIVAGKGWCWEYIDWFWGWQLVRD